jgi:hypothetical protein
LSTFFIGDGAGVEVSLLFLGCCQGEANSWLWLGALENRVSDQYIVLEASPGLEDLSRTFMVTPTKVLKSPKSWLGRIGPIWQEFESITSPTFGIPKLLLYASKIGVYLAHMTFVLDEFYVNQHQKKISTTFRMRTFLFDIVKSRSEWGIFVIFAIKTDFRKLRISSN